MRRDLALAKQLGANGVVFGILDVEGNVDVTRTRELVELARPLRSRSIAPSIWPSDLSHALDDVCAAGADRLLTSGGEPTSLQGQDKILQLVEQARGRITIMPGGGIKPENARNLIEHTGVTEIHVGLRSALPSPMLHRNPRVSMGSVEGREYQRFAVLEEEVRRLCGALDER